MSTILAITARIGNREQRDEDYAAVLTVSGKPRPLAPRSIGVWRRMVVGMFAISVAVLTNSLQVSNIKSQGIHVSLLHQRTVQTLTLTSVPSDEKQFETYEAGYVRF